MTKKILIVLIIILIILFNCKMSSAIDRCQEFIPDIRQYSLQYLGPTYPYWYNVGCAMSETNCRSNLVSFDGGIGLFQLTPSTGITKELSKYIPVNPYDAKSSIRAQSYYMFLIKDVKFKSKSITFRKHKISPKDYVDYCGLNLSDLYRFYNSGYWFFYESSRKPNTKFVCSNDEMKKYCVRGGTYTDKAKTKWLSFCDVSYKYPTSVFTFSKPYSNNLPDQMNYWYSGKKVIPKDPVVVEEKPKEEIKEEIKKEKPQEELKPYPGALPPPELINPLIEDEEIINPNLIGNDTFCIMLINKIKLFSL